MFEIIMLIIAFIALILASFHDLKTREVPDYLSYFLLGSAIVLRLMWLVYTQNLNVVVWAPVSFSVLFIFSYLMYRAGQWGGGDVKVMMGLSVLLCWFPFGVLPFFVDFFLNSLIVGAFYGMIAVGVIGIMNYKQLKEYLNSIDYILLPALFIATILIFVLLPPVFAFLTSLIVISVGLFKYFKIIETNFLHQSVPIYKLTEGDWLLRDVRLGGKLIVKQRDIGLTEEDIKKLQRYEKSGRIKKVPIKVGVPFVPAFLIALVVTILFGNVLLRIMSYGLQFGLRFI